MCKKTSSQICVKFDLDVGLNYYNPKERGLEKDEKEAIRRKLNQMRKGEIIEVALTSLASLYECSEALWNTSAIIDSSDLNETLDTSKIVKPENFERSNIDEHLREIEDKLTKWGEDITSQMNDIMKHRIDEALPDITKSVVDETINSKKFNRPWADLFKKTQNEFKTEANSVFKNTLSVALTESQHDVLEQLQRKHDTDMHEKEKRSRNILISNYPECESEISSERINHDMKFVKDITGISDNEILKCIRAGPKIDKQTGRKAEARPLIVTVVSPELAKKLHKYGNGNRVLSDGKIWWINPDLTLSERQANYRARELMRGRRSSGLGNSF